MLTENRLLRETCKKKEDCLVEENDQLTTSSNKLNREVNAARRTIASNTQDADYAVQTLEEEHTT
jgi:hypothetical protein